MRIMRAGTKLAWTIALAIALHQVVWAQAPTGDAATSPTATSDAATSPTSRPYWSDPEIVGLNKLPPRATMVFFPTVKEAEINSDGGSATGWKLGQSKWFISLNGKWKYAWSSSFAERPKDFYKPDSDDTGWEKIAVPSCVELTPGHGVPIYVKKMANDVYCPWGKLDPPNIPAAKNPVSSYRRFFVPPESWKGRRVVVHFDGVESAFYLWVNGKPVGYSEDSRSPAEFDLTPFVENGLNLIAVQVYRYSDGSYLEDQAKWRLSGIFRDVYLYSPGWTSVRDVSVKAGLDATFKNGVLSASMALENDGDKPTSVTARLQLADAHGATAVGVASASVVGVEVPAHGNATATLDIPSNALRNVRAWSAEDPFLYRGVLSLTGHGGAVIEAIPLRVGFRTAEVKGGRFSINGKPVMIKGVNRHEMDAKAGYAVGIAEMQRDLQQMKEANVNAVCGYYPDSPEWLDLCDAYGLYVVDEANIAAAGVGFDPDKALAAKPEWKMAYLARVQAMVERDKNHPSVVIWSIGEDAGDGPNVQACHDWIKQRDARPVQCGRAESSALSDIDRPSCPTVGDLIKRASINPSKPVIMSAYACSMGNSTGGLSDYWDAIQSRPALQGGFISDWADQGFLARNEKGIDYVTRAGDYPGDIPFDDNAVNNGLVNSDRKPHPALREVAKAYQNVKFELLGDAPCKLRVTNLFSFIDLRQCLGFYQVLVEGRKTQSGALPLRALAPGESQELTLPLAPLNLKPGQEAFLLVSMSSLKLTPWFQRGQSVGEEQFLLASRPRQAWTDDLASTATALTTRQTPASILVRDGDVSMRFGKASGVIEELWIGQKNVLQEPLEPNFWRAPTDNDAVRDPSVMSQDIWREAAPGRKVGAVTLKTTSQGRRVLVRVEGTMLGGKCPYEILYQVVAGIGLRAQMTIRPDASLPPLPRAGMRMTLAPLCTRMQWLGRGPQENYQDRLAGTRVDLFRGSALKFGFSYARPQENGNRCDVRWAAWQDSANTGVLAVHGANGFLSVSAHPYSLEQLERARHDCDLPRLGPIEVNIDAKQQGVGGGSSWDWRAKPAPQYRIPAKPMTFDFLLVPLNAGRKDLADLARRPLPDFPAVDAGKP